MLNVITFDQIAERVSAHYAAETTRNALAAQARRAVYALRSLLADLSAADRTAVLDLAADELPGLTGPCGFEALADA
jgi:hypothetical protein